MSMKKILLPIKVFGKQLRFSSFKPHKTLFLHKNVPYFAQWESRELIGKFLRGEMRSEDDPKWRQSGAKTKKEYALWTWNGCGMACLKMILAHSLKKEIPFVELGRRCMAYGGYKRTKSINKLEGLYYEPFVHFCKREFGLSAKVLAPMILPEIVSALEQRKYVIASVSPFIRNPKVTPKTQGGHLILIVGYDYEKKLLYFHNPSGDSKVNQEYAKISFLDFQKFFAKRGVVVYLDFSRALIHYKK